MKQRKITYCC